MKRLLLSLLLACGLPAMAADSTIGNLDPITTVPDTYRMPWENPAVQNYYITFLDLTNQILADVPAAVGVQIGSSNFVSEATLDGYALLSGTNNFTGTNTFTIPIIADGSLLTNLNASALASGTVDNARLPTNVLTNGQSTETALSNAVTVVGDLSVRTNIIATSNNVVLQVGHKDTLVVSNNAVLIGNTIPSTTLRVSGQITAVQGITVSGGSLLMAANQIINTTAARGFIGSASTNETGGAQQWNIVSGVGANVGGVIRLIADGASALTARSNGVTVSGSLTATNGFSSGSANYTKMPTNTPGDGQVLTATGTGGATAWKWGSLVNSNTFGSVPSLVPGDNFYFSSNGVPHVIWVDEAGTAATNRLVP